MRLAPFLSYGVLIWVAALIAAPAAVGSGRVAAVLLGAAIYRAASVVCHQIPERSFYLTTLPVAVCARCLGLYVGAAIVSLAMTFTQMRRVSRGAHGRVRLTSGPGSKASLLLAIASVPTASTWLLERGGWWAGNNNVRFVAAIPLGLAAAWIVLAALWAETAQKYEPQGRLGSP